MIQQANVSLFCGKYVKRMLVVYLMLFASGCTYFSKPMSIPMTSITDADNLNRDTLLVFLPGMRDEASDFVKRDFFKMVRAANLPLDMIAVDAYFSYYQQGKFKERFYQDVLAPNIKKGYKKIWLVGVSIGGYGSFVAAQEYAGIVSGIIVIAPWLGSEEMMAELVAQGGIKHWQPSIGDDEIEGHEKDLWVWLQGYSDESSVRPPLFLLYGRQDKFKLGHEALSKILPKDAVLTVEGEHNWLVWVKLWRQLLQHMEFQQQLID